MRRAWLGAAALALAAGCGGASAGAGAAQTQPVASARAAPLALRLERAADGAPLEFAALRGRAVLIVAFLMDHLGSHATLRNAEAVARAHGADVVVVAISGDRHPRRQHAVLLQTFGRVLDLERTELVLADDAVRDGSSPLGPIAHVPTVFLVNRAGVAARRVEGYLSVEQLEALVAPALPPRAGAAPPP